MGSIDPYTIYLPLPLMPKQLEMLIDNINKSGRDYVTCMVADESMVAFDIAEKLRIQQAALWSASASLTTMARPYTNTFLLLTHHVLRAQYMIVKLVKSQDQKKKYLILEKFSHTRREDQRE